MLQIIWLTTGRGSLSCPKKLNVSAGHYKACLTQDNLKKRSDQIVNGCYMCQQEIETNSHLFLHCKIASHIWCLFYSIFGLSCATHRSVKRPMKVGVVGKLIRPSRKSGNDTCKYVDKEEQKDVLMVRQLQIIPSRPNGWCFYLCGKLLLW